MSFHAAISSKYWTSAAWTENPGNLISVIGYEFEFANFAFNLKLIDGKHRACSVSATAETLAVHTVTMANHQGFAFNAILYGTAKTSPAANICFFVTHVI